MAREVLDRRISHLLDQILILDSLVEDAIRGSVAALKKHDIATARKIYANDNLINAKRFELENDCMVTIATQQPIMAGDLRMLASILEVVSELERMGDYAKGIAKICILIGKDEHVKPLIDIPRMAEISVSMLHRAVGAFVNLDIQAAQTIPDEDEEVDALYVQVYRELVAIMIAKPATIDQSNHLMWVAHNLERVSDRVTNICERAIYVATGQMSEVTPSDDETVVI